MSALQVENAICEHVDRILLWYDFVPLYWLYDLPMASLIADGIYALQLLTTHIEKSTE